MKLDQDYLDPRFVALYDRSNPRGADTDFYLGLAAEIHARTIVDLGCGTGLLTRELAIEGRNVIGVDPAAAMLDYARRQPGANLVRWIHGDAGAIGRPHADLAIMTGNVAQVFVEDAEWRATLAALHDALRPGGHLAFESRNPADRGWTRWNREATHEVVATADGPLESWLEVVRAGDGRVQFRGHNRFQATGETVIIDSELRFRTREELADTLGEAGFDVEQVYGDWQRGPVTAQSKVMVFVARRA